MGFLEEDGRALVHSARTCVRETNEGLRLTQKMIAASMAAMERSRRLIEQSRMVGDPFQHHRIQADSANGPALDARR